VSIQGSFDKITLSFFDDSGIDDINTYYLTWSMAARHIRMWVSEEHHTELKNNTVTLKDDTDEASIEQEDIKQVPSDKEVRAAAEKQHELIQWAQSLTQEQINFLLDGGWYNRAIKGYLIAAAENADLSDEQLIDLQNGLSTALDNYNKAEAENKFLSK
jgi:ParB family chromosome partitioning protein